MEPFLSVIIPTYNAARYVEECLSSVASQLGEDVEVIVQDAGSTDGTTAVYDRYHHILSRVDIRPDHGQSDAIDRGVRLARGRFVTWLNADDVMLAGALSALRQAASSQPEVEWWVGDTAVLDSNGLVKSATRAGGLVDVAGLRFVSVYGPSSFFTKRMYDAVGGIDLSFHYMMDTDLWNRFVTQGFHFKRLRRYVWGFRQHDGSKTTAHMFADQKHDPFASSEYRQNAERLECYLRHGVHGGGPIARASLTYAQAARAVSLSLPLQILDSRLNRGRHWSSFRRWP